jgi:hypothetical protein
MRSVTCGRRPAAFPCACATSSGADADPRPRLASCAQGAAPRPVNNNREGEFVRGEFPLRLKGPGNAARRVGVL